jgi:hypothetical protein
LSHLQVNLPPIWSEHSMESNTDVHIVAANDYLWLFTTAWYAVGDRSWTVQRYTPPLSHMQQGGTWLAASELPRTRSSVAAGASITVQSAVLSNSIYLLVHSFREHPPIAAAQFYRTTGDCGAYGTYGTDIKFVKWRDQLLLITNFWHAACDDPATKFDVFYWNFSAAAFQPLCTDVKHPHHVDRAAFLGY